MAEIGNGEMGKFEPDGEVETPFRRARQVWDDRIGSAKQRAVVWRTIAVICLGLVGLMAVSLVWRSSKADVTPYVVEVGDGGEVRLVGMPETQDWEPGRGVQRHFLAEWIRKVRQVSSDETVVRENILDAYDAVSGEAGRLLDERVEEENPFELADEMRREVEIESMHEVGEANSWRVEWVETRRDLEGYRRGEETYVGIFELERKQPETLEDIEKNPLGLFVVHFSWSVRNVGGQR